MPPEWVKPTAAACIISVLIRTLSRMEPGTHRYADDEHVAIGEAARILGASIVTVRRWIEAGRLAPTRTPGGHYRFKVADLRALLQPSDDSNAADVPAERAS